MSRIMKFFSCTVVGEFVVCIFLMMLKCISKIDSKTFVNIIGTLFLILFIELIFIAIGFIFYYSGRKKKVTKVSVGQYNLTLLDDTNDNIYVIKKYGSNGKDYLFIYVDDDGKNNFCCVNYADSSIKNNYTTPFIEIFERRYNVSGFLDYLFFNDILASEHKFSYNIHVNEENIRKYIA